MHQKMWRNKNTCLGRNIITMGDSLMIKLERTQSAFTLEIMNEDKFDKSVFPSALRKRWGKG